MEEEEKKDIRQQDATAQDGDAASGKSDRRKKLEREIGVELASYGTDQGGEQGTEREPSNEYMKSSKTVTRNVYDYSPEEAGKLSMRYAGDVQDDLAGRGLTLGEIVMRNYPKPAYAVDDEKDLKRRRTAALLSDSFKLISDMAAGAYGGNIYRRDDGKAYDRIDAGLQKLKDDYMRERDKWLNAQLAARQGDRDTFLANARMFYDDLRRPRQETESMTKRDIYEHQKDMDERGMKLREEAQRQQRRYYNWMFGGGKEKAEDKYVTFVTPDAGDFAVAKADGKADSVMSMAFANIMDNPDLRGKALAYMTPMLTQEERELLEQAITSKGGSFTEGGNSNSSALVSLLRSGKFDKETRDAVVRAFWLFDPTTFELVKANSDRAGEPAGAASNMYQYTRDGQPVEYRPDDTDYNDYNRALLEEANKKYEQYAQEQKQQARDYFDSVMSGGQEHGYDDPMQYYDFSKW